MKKESGFTLIEIVMVLVLLGILSAVAVPKYFDLQKQAQQQAANAFVAEYQARLNAKFASEILGGKDCATAVTSAKTEAAKLGTESASAYTIELAATAETGETITNGAALYIATVTPKSTGASAIKKPDGKDFKVAIPVCGS